MFLKKTEKFEKYILSLSTAIVAIPHVHSPSTIGSTSLCVWLCPQFSLVCHSLSGPMVLQDSGGE